jgi:hypothetical protein
MKCEFFNTNLHKIFLLLRRIQHDIVINVHKSACSEFFNTNLHKIFLLLRRIQHDIVINVHKSACIEFF